MSTATLTGFTQEAFDAFLAAREEPDWLVAARRAAWQAFQELPLPSRADEEWMRTDIRLLRLDKFAIPDVSHVVTLPDALLAHGVELGGRTSTLDSHPAGDTRGNVRLSEKSSGKGVLFGRLDELVVSPNCRS